MNWLLVLWLVFAAVGFGAAVWNFSDGMADLRFLRRAKRDGLARLSAVSSVRREVLRLAIQAMFLFIGLAAVVAPESALVGWFTVFSLFAVGAITSFSSLYDRYDRERILDYKE